MSDESTASSGPRLRRTLTLWDLILYGVIVIQPVAPMSSFGALSDRGHGHVVTAILIAMVGMLFTGISYGRMARAYPSAGSAFNAFRLVVGFDPAALTSVPLVPTTDASIALAGSFRYC